MKYTKICKVFNFHNIQPHTASAFILTLRDAASREKFEIIKFLNLYVIISCSLQSVLRVFCLPKPPTSCDELVLYGIRLLAQATF